MWIRVRRYLPDDRTTRTTINTDNILWFQFDGKETKDLKVFIQFIDGSNMWVDAQEWTDKFKPADGLVI